MDTFITDRCVSPRAGGRIEESAAIVRGGAAEADPGADEPPPSWAARGGGQPPVPSGVVVRRAHTGDAGAIASIERLAFGATHDQFSFRRVRSLIANPRAIVVSAEVEGRVVGWCVALVRRHGGARSGRIYSVAVDHACAGRGVGRRLLTWSLDALAEAGIARVYLEVRTNNQRAIGLYRSLGFSEIARLPEYYNDGGEGVRMRRLGPAPVVANGTPATYSHA
jgi:ribosomal protein S18 acetylase RimI-like enzyme